ncbi:MAG: hypothetical protein PHY51_02445 [Candidatus Gracilibacteria bacterium]|nr:hypothetical protein [Candidatus Gracilibacteria bacterium]
METAYNFQDTELPNNTELPMKRLLIIEDDLFLQKSYKWGSVGKIDLIQATTFDEAKKIIQDEILDKEIPTINAISFDFNLDLGHCSSSLINSVNGKFKGIMIAASGDPQGRKTQLLLGCTHELERKAELIDFILGQTESNNQIGNELI